MIFGSDRKKTVEFHHSAGKSRVWDKLYLEKKRPQPKGRKITTVLDNKISEVWAILFQNLAK